MANGYIAPQLSLMTKTSQSNSVYTDGKWHVLINDDLYLEESLPSVGSSGGWGTSVKTGVGTNAKSHEMGYDIGGDVFHVFTRAASAGAIRFQTTPYTPSTDTYGTTTTTRLDESGDDYNNTGFDNGQVALITDQQGNPLLLSIGSSSFTGPVGDGLSIGYDFPNRDYAQIQSGFNKGGGTNVDAFLFNDGSNDFVGVLFSDGTNFKLAYHITEATVTNYSTGWDVETIGVPASNAADDHCCARAFDGSMFATVKGGTGDKIFLITTTGGIDTATNSTTFVFTEVDNDASRPIIVIDETNEELYVVYMDLGADGIKYKKQPLSGFSFTPSTTGTALIDNGTDNFIDPTGPVGNVTASMGTFNIFARNTTGTDTTWFQRVELISSGLDISPTSITSSEAFGSPTVATGNADISPSSIGSAESVGSPTVAQAITVSPNSIGSAEAIGSPTLATGNADIATNSIASAESVGSPSISVGTQVVAPNSIASAEAFGTATVVTGAVTLLVNSISSEESFGIPTLAFPAAKAILIEGNEELVINTNSGGVTLYFNGKHYFSV